MEGDGRDMVLLRSRRKSQAFKVMGWKMGDWEKAIREAWGRLEEYGRDGGLEGSDKCRRSLRQPLSIEGHISIEGQPIPRLTSLWHVSPPRDALRVQGTSSDSGFLW